MAQSIKILGISGSLRAKSCNTGLLRAAQALSGTRPFSMEILTYTDLMIFNQDIEDQGNPEVVERVRAAVQQADGVLFATAEYNGACLYFCMREY